MHVSSSSFAVVTAALGLSGQASPFVIQTYSKRNCTGLTQEVNIWDNSCGSWMMPFQSFKAKAYGGKHQQAYFYGGGGCLSTMYWGPVWVDGGDSRFNLSSPHCVSFPEDWGYVDSGIRKGTVYGVDSYLPFGDRDTDDTIAGSLGT